MSDWRQQAIEAGAQAIVALDHYAEDEWQVFTPDAAAVVDAVEPIIRADEREQVLTGLHMTGRHSTECLTDADADCTMDGCGCWCHREAVVRADEGERRYQEGYEAGLAHGATLRGEAVRADERERAARRIEARIADNPHYEPWRETMEFAASIARGVSDE